AEGAVWLDAKRTSRYRFYQFFVNAEDSQVGTLLRTLTFLSQEEIEALEAESKSDPGARAAQKALARGVTSRVHWAGAVPRVVKASEVLFGSPLDDIGEEVFDELVGEVPSAAFEKSKLASPGAALVDVLVHAGLCPSKSQARKDIDGGGIYVNNLRV